MKMTQLSVSSAILAAVLSGCSQQQVIGGSQVSAGSQQSGGSQVASQRQNVASSQTSTSQQQVETAKPAVYKPATPKAKRVYHKKPKPVHSVRRSGLPAAQPGQCFARVKLPATYKTQSRRVLIQKATAKRVLVRAPQYRWVNKKVLVRKQSYKSRTIPAQYKTVVNRVMVKPAYNTWRKGHGAITRIDNMTGEIMCRVKIPAVYKTVKKRVLVRPAKTLRTFVPAVYKTVKQKQFVSPALYKTVRTPDRYKTKNYRVKTGGARYVWRAVLCKTNAPKHYGKKHYAKRVSKNYKKTSKKYHKVASNHTRRVAPKQYRQAPKHYRKVAVARKPVVRNHNYATQYKQSGINYQDYLRVMNTGSKNTASSYQTPKRINRKVSYRNTVNIKKQSTPRKIKADTRRGIVYGIQKALKAKGFDPGSMDGKMNAGTAAALKAFQSSRGLPVGRLSKDTFRALGMIR